MHHVFSCCALLLYCILLCAQKPDEQCMSESEHRCLAAADFFWEIFCNFLCVFCNSLNEVIGKWPTFQFFLWIFSLNFLMQSKEARAFGNFVSNAKQCFSCFSFLTLLGPKKRLFRVLLWRVGLDFVSFFLCFSVCKKITFLKSFSTMIFCLTFWVLTLKSGGFTVSFLPYGESLLTMVAVPPCCLSLRLDTSGLFLRDTLQKLV